MWANYHRRMPAARAVGQPLGSQAQRSPSFKPPTAVIEPCAPAGSSTLILDAVGPVAPFDPLTDCRLNGVMNSLYQTISAAGRTQFRVPENQALVISNNNSCIQRLRESDRRIQAASIARAASLPRPLRANSIQAVPAHGNQLRPPGEPSHRDCD
jgi:hypothetical protein